MELTTFSRQSANGGTEANATVEQLRRKSVITASLAGVRHPSELLPVGIT